MTKGPEGANAGDDALLRLRAGSQLGRYELVAIVASGGMGRVWAARAMGHQGFRRLVALKTILPTFAAIPEFEQRFLDEAKIAAQIHHPNVCQIDDLGEASGILYMALEWIDGAPLSELYPEAKGPEAKGTESKGRDAKSGKPTPVDPRFAARIASQVCAGLHAAHELRDEEGKPLGVVHRDVSPQNVLVGEGVVKVTDFGIAKAFGRSHQTKKGEVRGKAPYLAPEQLQGQTVDRRTDVYATGALLYEISTGERAFDGETDAQILVKVLNEAPIPPGEIVAGYPPELQSIVLRALSKRPSQRFPSALEMQRALEQYLARAEPLTDGAMAKIVEERLGAEIQKRRDLVKRASSASVPNVQAAAPSSSSIALSADDLISDSRSMPIGIANTSPSAIDLPRGPALLKPPVPVSLAAKATLLGVPGAAGAAGAAPKKPPPPPSLRVKPPANSQPAPSSDAPPAVMSGSDLVDMPSSLIAPQPQLQAMPSPGFLDPAKLRAARVNAPNVPPPDSESAMLEPESSNERPKLELEKVDLMAVAENLRVEYELSGPRPKKVVAEAPRERKLWPTLAAGSAGLIVLFAIAGVALAPRYAGWKLTNAAAEAGLDASWGKLSVSLSGITLQDVSLRAPEINGVAMTTQQVELTPLLSPSHATLRGGTVSLDGPSGDLSSRAKVWGLAHPAVNSVANVTIEDAHVEWPRVFADSHVLRADGAHVEISRAGRQGGKMAFTSPSVRLDGDRGSFGPWGVDVTTDDSGTTMHAALDPSVPQEAAVSVTLPADAPPSITVHVSRTPLGRLGIAPSVLGLAASDSTQLEMEAQIAGSAPSRIRGEVHLTMHDARTASMPVPIDIVLAANVAGDTRDPIPFKVTELMLGPLRAQADTMLDAGPGSFRIDGKWSAQMPCARMADVGSDAGFGLGSTSTPLGKLMKNAARSGDAVVSGTVTFDVSQIDSVRFAPTYASTCGIPLLTALAVP